MNSHISLDWRGQKGRHIKYVHVLPAPRPTWRGGGGLKVVSENFLMGSREGE